MMRSKSVSAATVEILHRCLQHSCCCVITFWWKYGLFHYMHSKKYHLVSKQSHLECLKEAMCISI